MSKTPEMTPVDRTQPITAAEIELRKKEWDEEMDGLLEKLVFGLPPLNLIKKINDILITRIKEEPKP